MMTTNTGTEPLWLAIERKLHEVAATDLATGNKERTVQQIAGKLDESGYNVSRHGGHMLQLRWAVDARSEVGRPFLQDFLAATEALTLDDVVDPLKATVDLVREVGDAWPRLKDADRQPDVLAIVEQTKLDLTISKAKELDDDLGIRFLLGDEVPNDTIIDRMGISQEKLDEVIAAIEAEAEAKARVESLLGAVEGASDIDKAKHLITNDIPENEIVSYGGLTAEAIAGAQKAMAAEIAEQKRLAEEEAARKQAEAEGPSLDSIPDDEMVEFIESIQEILEFSEEADEIRQMCEQSSIPKVLVDVAVSEPDKLEAMLEAAGG